MFLNQQQIVEDLLNGKNMSDAERNQLKNMKKKELIKCHRALGARIRNEYQFWNKDNPIVKRKHPDDVSQEIIVSLWEKLQ